MFKCTVFAVLGVSSIAIQLPLTYMEEGEVCKQSGSETWRCRETQACPARSTDGGEQTKPCGRDPVKPLTCCPPTEHAKIRQSLANYYCEKYMESCGGVFGIKTHDADDNSYAALEIAGGREAIGGSEPHMALIGSGHKWICGGSLISERFVLTAAHCASTDTHDGLKVRLGELDYSKTDESLTEDVSVSRVVLHPDYKNDSLYHDIALLELERDVQFSSWIRPICLHTQPTVPFTKATVTGWGRTGPVEPLSSRLLVADVNLVTKRKCRTLTRSNSKLTRGIADDSMICAGHMTGKPDTCQGDSGGPLYVQISNRCLPTQIGITSFGALCTRPNSPGVYTKVYHYLHWIEQVVWAKVDQ